MANNCWNYVVFNGDATQIKKVRSKFKEYDKTNYFTEFGDFVLDKGKIGDTVEILEKRHKDSFYTYGTKWWEFDLDDHEEGAEDFTIAGDSAWSPPISLVERICMVYNLTAQMEYEENGMNFAGFVEFDNLGITTNREMSADEYASAQSKLQELCARIASLEQTGANPSGEELRALRADCGSLRAAVLSAQR